MWREGVSSSQRWFWRRFFMPRVLPEPASGATRFQGNRGTKEVLDPWF